MTDEDASTIPQTWRQEIDVLASTLTQWRTHAPCKHAFWKTILFPLIFPWKKRYKIAAILTTNMFKPLSISVLGTIWHFFSLFYCLFYLHLILSWTPLGQGHNFCRIELPSSWILTQAHIHTRSVYYINRCVCWLPLWWDKGCSSAENHRHSLNRESLLPWNILKSKTNFSIQCCWCSVESKTVNITFV